MDLPAAVWDIDPAVDQGRVGFTVTVFDDPITQTVSTRQNAVEMAYPVVMAVKSEIVALGT